MYTKLTLNIDKSVIKNAKEYAKHQKRSVSRLVEEYLSSISSTIHEKHEKTGDKTLGPITKELVGIIKVKEKADYKDILTGALMEKYL
ncbi:MAG: DUF6364 family protein [Treponema sp.]|jgi:hypothetical protein|nr:DUF6364 family protein [Treponema sp.]